MNSTAVTFSNPCTRCGKERIDGKTWKEKVVNHFGTSYIYHTETVCPDKECQKIVQEKLDKERKRAEEIKLEKEKRLKAQAKLKKPVSIRL